MSDVISRTTRRMALDHLVVANTRPDWLAGALLGLVLALTLALSQSWDDARALNDARVAAESRAERDRAAREIAEHSPQIRLEGRELQCRNFWIRDEWVTVIAKECERLGGLLRAARATP